VKFGVKSRLEHETLAGYQIFQEAVEEAVLAEKLGFDSYWTSEVHASKEQLASSPLIILSALSQHTQKIRLAVGVFLLSLRNPLLVAEETATLDNLSQGRLILTAGIGSPIDRLTSAFNIDRRNIGSRFEENVKLLKRFWLEDNVSYQGSHFNCQEALASPKPIQKPHPPLWIGTSPGNARGLRRAAFLGDAWLPNSIYDATSLREDWNLYEGFLREAGKDPGRVVKVVQRNVFLAKNRDEALSKIEPAVRRLYAEIFTKIGFTVKDTVGELIDPASASFDRFRQGRFIAGNTDDCIKEIEKLQSEVGLNYLVLRVGTKGLSHQDVMSTITLLGSDVLPYFRGTG
jgi:alkanesulfonate monooxygenase SsuD/methylene tetrahydromethanopterin reductase-like flavin-dependent oxidoreductase (luciferase family)